MSHRIFVNSQNQTFKEVTRNGKGFMFGLGIPTELSDDERIELQQKAYEIYFSADDLREKQRKIKIIFDSLTDPKFFGDGAVKLDKVEKYISDLQLEAQQAPTASTLENFIIFRTFLAATPFVGVLGALGLTQAITSNRQAGREDNAAPWKMTRLDFPNITAQAIQNSSTRRSIERLYDSRNATDVALNKNQVSTQQAIARLVRESLADALFCTTNSPNGTTSQEHPGPGDDSRLRNYFPFKEETTGSDRNERTYVNALIYLKSYIDLIDNILNLQNESLSRSPDLEQALINIPIRISLATANVPLFTALANSAREVIREKVLTFFDENREYKTLLNFGNDRQYVAEAWRLAPQDTGSVQLKLITPLDNGITVETPAFISRELAESVVDIINFELSPAVDNTPYLRPFNMDSRNYVDSKMLATNTTLVSLGLATGSAGAIIDGTTVSYEDAVFRRWFTGDFKSSELNIDFTDYKNFVHFGSAYKRLEAFTQKLEKIEELTSASISSSVSSSTATLLLKAREKENIIRNFDPYEQFLYYATESIAYSASAFYVNDEVEYHATGSWPKQVDGTPYSPYSTTATNWLTVQEAIAQRYDENNPNYLVLNLPKHIQEDIDSSDFLTLFELIGHLVDNIKVYIDQFPNIYSTNIDPLKDLSMDQVYEVAQSFGLNLPNVYALENLQSFNAQFTGESGSRSYVAETWKRFLHSMNYFLKTKGSRTSFDALLNAYGIDSPILQIKETTAPAANNYIKSDELTYGLQFTGSAVNTVTVPLVSSSLTGLTVQLSFNPTSISSTSLLTAETWAVDLIPHPSASKETYGRIQIVSGSGRTVIATSSYFPLFSDDYTNLMLRSQSGDFSIIQTDGDQILFQESASVNLSSLWNSTTNIYLGGTGSIKLANNFDGIIDEVRVWGENISDEDFVAQAYDPGSYYGANYTSSYANLYVHVPFSQPLSSITSSVKNESPYQNVSIVSTLPANGFTTASFKRILRTIKQFTPIVGSSIYTNKKITIAPPPVFNTQFIDGDGTKVLSRISSIKQIEEKQDNSGKNTVFFGVSPTNYINQNIMRSMGVVDVNNLIGSPRYVVGNEYSTLQKIRNDYNRYFGISASINPNEYIRFFKDLTQGPSEMADEMVPARAKLIDGVIIESSVLSRNKYTTYNSFKVDGTATKKFNSFIAGSGSIGVGAYDFSVMYEKMSLLPSPDADTLPIEATIVVSDDVDVKESTKSSKLPPFQRVLQKISNDYVTSSLLDQNSSFATLEAPGIDGTPTNGVNAFIISEIPPRSDFSDVGTYTYFHKKSGIYSFDVFTLYKQEYTVKLDTDVDSPQSRLYAPITLLPPTSTALETGRRVAIIPSTTYTSESPQVTGVLKIASIFTLYAITGASGLRIRMYRNAEDQENDKDRLFDTLPASNSGVLFDGLLDGAQEVFPYVLMQTNDSLIYYTIDNLTSNDIVSSVVANYFAYEPDNLAPNGYLPRHYKFSRDNNTALKRRNYLGCRDVNLTFDNQSPFSVSISTQNTVTVNSVTAPAPAGSGTVNIPEQLNTIKFGGGGRLGVE